MQVINVKVKFIRPQYHDLKSWMSDPNNLYIGRKGVVFINGIRFPPENSPWCNPYKVGRGGTREEVIKKYKEYIMHKISTGEVNLGELKGKTLGCWCKPDHCHGDILMQLSNE